MKILKSWITEYLPEIADKSNAEIADLFHDAGIEVESIEEGIHGNVIVAEILNVERHPNADRLSLADVTDNATTYKIVCGAPNIKAGQRVPLAKIGAILPGGLEIKKSKIRDVESEGMLCAADELGLGSDHSGIMILPDEYEIGKALNSYLGNETIFDISITPNRGDWLSHFGVARELGAFLGIITRKSPISLKRSSVDVNSQLKVMVQDADKCPQYYARVIRGVKIGDSPGWLKDKLAACGIRSINNVVDVTNYILLDLGHPLHAFDYAKIRGKEIIVRTAEAGEKITSLDDTDRTLTGEDLVIADKERPVAIAGIMGGANSEVSDNTVDIVLEAAVFNPKNIRATAKRLKLVSEASYRFERGIDNGGTEYAINKAAKLISEIAGGQVVSGIIKVGETPDNRRIALDYKKINSLLGLELFDDKINHLLKSLGFEIGDNRAVVPLWRNDVSLIEDLAEEVGRLNGYDKITPILFKKERPTSISVFYNQELIKDIAAGSGFSEILSYPYLSAKDIEALKLSKTDLLEVANPLQEEYKFLRASLLPGLIKAVAKNPAFDSVLLFEIAHVYGKAKEATNLAMVAAGKNARPLLEKAVDELSKALSIQITDSITDFPREQLSLFKVRKPAVYTFEIGLDALLAGAKIAENKLKLRIADKEIAYRPVSKFPMIVRDLSFIVERSQKVDDIAVEILGVSDLISRVELFDEFASDQFGKGKKSVAYHLYLDHLERTLTDQEAEEVVKKVIKLVKEKFKAELRS